MMKMKTGQVIPSHLLPKTGQSAYFRTGDDGDLEKGWWKGLSLAGNKTRFVARTLDGDAVVIDNATGLMWPAYDASAGCNGGVGLLWNAAIDYALALDFAGFTDWRIPNILELLSIVNFGDSTPSSYATFFTDIESAVYQSSTTYHITTTNYWGVNFGTSDIGSFTKSAFAKFLRCVRSL